MNSHIHQVLDENSNMWFSLHQALTGSCVFTGMHLEAVQEHTAVQDGLTLLVGFIIVVIIITSITIIIRLSSSFSFAAIPRIKAPARTWKLHYSEILWADAFCRVISIGIG